MRSTLLIICTSLLVMAPPAFAQSGGSVVAGTSAHTQLARVGGGGFGSRGFGSRFGSRNRGFGNRSRRGRGRGIFRSILRALAIGYLLHLLFTTPGGLLVLVLMIVAVVLLMSRFRARRRAAWRY